MFSDVKKAWKKIEDCVITDCKIDDFKGLCKEEKIDLCDEAIDEMESISRDLQEAIDALYDYQTDLEG